ncbi:MAG TPA: helix-turn-helix domain-containing protein [Polyangiaceae bacterium]
MLTRASSNLAHNIKRLREERALSQQELADAAGIPRPTIANLETGTANPTLAVLLKVAASLGAVVEDLVGASAQRAKVHKRKELPERKRTGVVVRRLIPEAQRPADFERVELSPGGRLGAASEGSGAREYVACESGEIDVSSVGDVLRLGPGDVAMLTAEQPRGYANRGRKKAVAYRLVTGSR